MTVPGTRLGIPVSRRPLVARRRLLDRLSFEHGSMPRLLLVAAPAGSGKTTLLAQWLSSARATRVAWLALAAGDDLTQFLQGVTAAVLRSERGADIGAEAAAMLRSAPDAPADAVLASIIDDLDAAEGTTVVALDDYHLVESAAVHDAVGFLLDNLPPNAVVAMTTRVDPPLPLARLRARGELVEIRTADLQFTLDEADAFLNEAMGLHLSDEHVRVLEARTEGWAAGLQLAGLTAQGRRDDAGAVASFVDAFAGSSRFVVDYLLDEVLAGQDEHVREFLLATSILRELSGPLCDAVTGRADGQAMLERLERSNLFLIGLDDERRWFRYHQLFADALRAQLDSVHPGGAAGLHRAAARWCAEQGMLSDAVSHALAGGASDDAATWLELALPRMKRARQDLHVREWLERLPAAVVREHALLAAFAAWARVSRGDILGAREWLDDAELALGRPSPATLGGIVAPPGPLAEAERERDHELLELPATIESYRAVVAQASGDVRGAAEHAGRALERAPEDDHYTRGAAGGLLALAEWAAGDLNAAIAAFAEAIENLRAGGSATNALGGVVVIATMQLERGDTLAARRLYQEALAEASRTPAGASILGDLHVGLAQVLVERGDLGAAAGHLAEAARLGDGASLPENRYRRPIAEAALARARGDVDAAADLLTVAEEAYLPGYLPDVTPSGACRARALIAGLRLEEAEAWATGCDAAGLVGGDVPAYLEEYESLTAARLRVARGREDPGALDGVARWLGRVTCALRDTNRGRGLLDALAVAAVVADAAGDRSAALDLLGEALHLSAAGGQARLILDEGEPMLDLLREAARRGGAGAPRASELLALARRGGTGPAPTVAVGDAGLPDPLSERELEVLRLLGSELSGPQIARRMYVSINTFRTHTKSIFLKLGVNTRRAAVRRAAELSLL